MLDRLQEVSDLLDVRVYASLAGQFVVLLDGTKVWWSSYRLNHRESVLKLTYPTPSRITEIPIGILQNQNAGMTVFFNLTAMLKGLDLTLKGRACQVVQNKFNNTEKLLAKASWDPRHLRRSVPTAHCEESADPDHDFLRAFRWPSASAPATMWILAHWSFQSWTRAQCVNVEDRHKCAHLLQEIIKTIVTTPLRINLDLEATHVNGKSFGNNPIKVTISDGCFDVEELQPVFSFIDANVPNHERWLVGKSELPDCRRLEGKVFLGMMVKCGKELQFMYDQFFMELGIALQATLHDVLWGGSPDRARPTSALLEMIGTSVHEGAPNQNLMRYMKATKMFFAGMKNTSYSMDAIGRMDKRKKFLIAMFLHTNKAAWAGPQDCHGIPILVGLKVGLEVGPEILILTP